MASFFQARSVQKFILFVVEVVDVVVDVVLDEVAVVGGVVIIADIGGNVAGGSVGPSSETIFFLKLIFTTEPYHPPKS